MFVCCLLDHRQPSAASCCWGRCVKNLFAIQQNPFWSKLPPFLSTLGLSVIPYMPVWKHLIPNIQSEILLTYHHIFRRAVENSYLIGSLDLSDWLSIDLKWRNLMLIAHKGLNYKSNNKIIIIILIIIIKTKQIKVTEWKDKAKMKKT